MVPIGFYMVSGGTAWIGVPVMPSAFSEPGCSSRPPHGKPSVFTERYRRLAIRERASAGERGSPAATPDPAYQLLADELRAQITSGLLRPGDRLPTEPELCVRCGVSRSTGTGGSAAAVQPAPDRHHPRGDRGQLRGAAHPSELAESLSTGVRLLLATGTVGVTELMEVREMLEVPAAGLAARRRTEADLERLQIDHVRPDQ